MDDRFFMRLALNEAQAAADEGEIPVGAVLVCGDRVVGAGRNRRVLGTSPLAHAEMEALATAARELGTWRFDDCTLYVTLEPCPMCAGALVQTRIRRLVYGARDPRAGAAGSLYDIPRDPRLAHKCKVKSDLLAADCEKILREFFIKKRKNLT